VNNFLNDQWMQSVEEYLAPQPGDLLVDLFCGSGLIALSLASSLRAGVGIEGNGNAVRNARLNAERNGIENVTFHLRDLTRRIDLECLAPAGGGRLKVVADPPRTGLAEHMIESIRRLNPSTIVYVSCNSATFARDLRFFTCRGYRMERLLAIDMFPRTQHVEMVARLVPAALREQRKAAN
jgi:23S rRNA (uracil1939-C5)-methyltransferase